MNSNKWLKPNGPHLSGLKEVKCGMLNYELLSVVIHPEERKMASIMAIFKMKTEGRSKWLFFIIIGGYQWIHQESLLFNSYINHLE